MSVLVTRFVAQRVRPDAFSRIKRDFCLVCRGLCHGARLAITMGMQPALGGLRDQMESDMTTYLCNAFSLSMLDWATQGLPVECGAPRTPCPISLGEAQAIARRQFESAVGHADTAAVFAAVLGTAVAASRITVRLLPGDVALVGQYVGPRLPEGATALPEGATIEWWLV
jgi:hypothetical protein